MASILYTHVRYASICLMIDFYLPATALSLSDYMELVELQDECGSCAGYCVSFGESFFTSGVCSELYLFYACLLVFHDKKYIFLLSPSSLHKLYLLRYNRVNVWLGILTPKMREKQKWTES